MNESQLNEDVADAQLIDTTPLDPLRGFDKFWDAYPKRNGKRVGRQDAEKRWRPLSLDDRRAAWRGAVNYAQAVDRGLTIAKDAFRFLRDRSWEDWLDGPGEVDRGNGHRPGQTVTRYDHELDYQ